MDRPAYAIKYAALIRDELTTLDPENASYYADNYAAFEAKANELADAVRDGPADRARRATSSS